MNFKLRSATMALRGFMGVILGCDRWGISIGTSNIYIVVLLSKISLETRAFVEL